MYKLVFFDYENKYKSAFKMNQKYFNPIFSQNKLI